jgi:hypothetical protein
MAIVKEVHFSRTKSFGVYENVRIGAVAEVVYPKTEDNVLVDLKEWVDAKISEEVNKPVVEMKTEELKQLEGYVAERREALKALEAEIKAKRRELDRCIEVGMRSLFEGGYSTCPHTNLLLCPHAGTDACLSCQVYREASLRRVQASAEDTESGIICPHCNKVVAAPNPIPDGWSKTCPWCGYRFPDTHYGKLWWGKEVQPPDRDVSLNDTKAHPPPPEGAGVDISGEGGEVKT